MDGLGEVLDDHPADHEDDQRSGHEVECCVAGVSVDDVERCTPLGGDPDEPGDVDAKCCQAVAPVAVERLQEAEGTCQRRPRVVQGGAENHRHEHETDRVLDLVENPLDGLAHQVDGGLALHTEACHRCLLSETCSHL